MGGKRTCMLCKKKFYRTDLINKKYAFWCKKCWLKREARIKKGDKILKIYTNLWNKNTKN